MVYSPGFDIRAAAEGAKAATDIALQPTIQETAKAAAKEAVAKSEYETGRYKALQDYMKGTTPATRGADIYQALNNNQEIQSRQKAIDAEEDRIRNLAPEDQIHARTSLDRQQKLLDAVIAKQQQYASKHLDETFSILNHVTDQKTLEGARQFYQDEVASVADQAIRDGKIAPENREAFINDQVNKLLPKTFDEKGKAMIDSKKNAMLTAKEQVDFKNAETKAKQERDFAEKQIAASNRASHAAIVASRSADLKTMQLALDTVHKEVSEGEAAIRNVNDQIDSLVKEKKEIFSSGEQKVVTGESEGIMGFFKSDIKGENPRLKMIDDQIREKNALLSRLREEVDQSRLSRDILKEKLGVKKLPASPKESVGFTQDNPAKPTDNASFAKLKSGDWFINPKDGKVLQKK